MRRDLDPTSRNDDAILVGGGIVLVVVLLGGAWVSLHGAAALNSEPAPPDNPVQLLLQLGSGEVAWTVSATVVAVALLVALLLLAAIPLRLRAKARKREQRPDRAAKLLARPRDVQHVTAAGAAAKAKRLGVATDSPGVPLGRRVPGGARIFSSWEDMVVVVAGPRTMKTTAYAIPAILAAPGAVLSTSNKRDVVDATREVRADRGQVWIFDPQRVANQEPTWWWNPLTYVAPQDPATGHARRDPGTGLVVADEAKAEKLAGQLCASALPAGARQDAYFDPEAENLIGLLLLAAAVGDQVMTAIYTWLTRPGDLAPVELLAEHGFTLQEQSLYALATLPDKQRDGVYGTARSRLGFLRNRAMVTWITPPTDAETGGGVREFHPSLFATSTDTLYPLSREGEGSAGPLVAALTVAVVDALEERATAQPGGRLQVPFLAVLDEAANICRFRNLDSYYSHFGSRGIIMITILQNWAQGEEVWGTKGMEKLWSAANWKVYGGGVDDDKFLRRISDLIGTHTRVARSESSGGRGGRQRSRSVEERTILTVGELRELPSAGKDGHGGRAVAFASGTPAMLLEPQPWWISNHAAQVRKSLATHTPEGTP